MNNEKKALFLALITVLIWSTIASAFKLSLTHLKPVHLVFYSSLISSFVSFLICLFKKTSVLKIQPKNFLFSLFSGFLNPFLYYIILLKAYDILPAQSAQVLNYTWGMTLAFMSFIFLKHKPLKRDFVSIAICYFGVFFIASKGNFSAIDFKQLKGVYLALGSTLIWSSYWILNTKDRLEPEIRLFWNFLFGSFYAFLFMIFSSGFKFNPAGFAGAVYIGFFEMGISFFLWLSAMKLTKNASRISNLIYLSPVVSLFIINKMIGEQIMPSTIFGLIFIFAGILIQNIGRTEKNSGKSGVGS